MGEKLFIKSYTKGDGSGVQHLLPGIFRLSKNKRLKRDILQNTENKVCILMLAKQSQSYHLEHLVQLH